MKLRQYSIFLLLSLGASVSLLAQKNEKIKYKAEVLEMVKQGSERIRKLRDNVVFTQETTTVYCDSSYFYNTRNEMEAFGHVKIVDDSTVITSKKLIYFGDTRKANLREKVVYTNGERRLFTDFLDYDLDNEIAHYFNKGKLIDSTNTLTSEIGFFYSTEKYALFWNNVVLIAPDYTLKTDTLRYDTETKIAYTYGRTEILTEDSTTLHAKGGEFRTESDQSEFEQGQVETPDYVLDGDELYFDDLKKYYKSEGNTKLTAKGKDLIIIGDEGYYDKNAGFSKIYGRPVMKRILKNDTLYLSADTLVAIESKYDSLKRVLAYHNVKIFKKGLQGKADSMAYFRQDSIIFFYRDPIMWNGKNQITSDTIALYTKDGNLDKMHLNTRAFLISEDTLMDYNQIKGRRMVATFEDNAMKLMDVMGNGEMLYYGLEKGDSIMMGMNKIFCSTMKIEFIDNKLSRFRVYTLPEAQFIPPHELTAEIQRLENFSWRIEEKPELYDVAYYLDPNYDPTAPPLVKDDKPKSNPSPPLASARPPVSNTKSTRAPSSNKSTAKPNTTGRPVTKRNNTNTRQQTPAPRSNTTKKVDRTNISPIRKDD